MLNERLYRRLLSNTSFYMYFIKLWLMGIYTCIKLLTHLGRVMHICVSNLAIIGSNNGLSPGRCQAIIWTNARILLIVPLGTNFSELLIKIHTFSFKKMLLRMSSGKWRQFCLDLNVLIEHYCYTCTCYTNHGISDSPPTALQWGAVYVCKQNILSWIASPLIYI